MIKLFVIFYLFYLPITVLSQGQLNIQCYGTNESPINIKRDYQCRNNADNPFDLNMESKDILIDLTAADYHRKYIVNSEGVSLSAKDTNQIQQNFILTSIEIYTPGRHRLQYKNMFSSAYAAIIPDIELVLYMQAEQSTSDTQDNSQNLNGKQPIKNAAVSFLFNRNETVQEISWYMDGSFFLQPFTNNQNSFTINPAKAFQSFSTLKLNHGFYQYYGSKIAEDCTSENMNWFVFDDMLIVSNDIYQYFYQNYGQQNILYGALRDIQQFNRNPVIKVGCFLNIYEKLYETSNYGFWGYLIIFTLYFLCAFMSPNHKNIYKKEYRNNLNTLIPLYSIFTVEHPVYFNKNCRSTLYLIQITLQMFIQCIIMHYLNGKTLFIVFSVISVLISWPICFGLGMFNYFNYKRYKVILDSEIKIIKATEHHKDDEEYIQLIEKSQFQSHTIMYIFYILSIALVLLFWILSSFIMQNWSGDQLMYWGISVPIMIAVDLIFDIVIAKSKIKSQFFACKGYYFDTDLADLIAQNKNIKIL